jgi:hypothetical protein
MLRPMLRRRLISLLSIAAATLVAVVLEHGRPAGARAG